MMRKTLFAGILLFAAVPAFSQNVYVQTVRMTSANTSAPTVGWGLAGRGITGHMFTWVTEGTVSAGACRLQSSADSTFASPSDVIAAQTVTSTGAYTTLATANVNFVRINCSTPISGSGSVTFTYIGLPAGGTAYDFAVIQAQLTNLQTSVTAIENSNAAIETAVESTDPVGVTPSLARCNLRTTYSNTTNGRISLVPAVSSQVVHICGFAIKNSTATAVSVTFGTGTGAACVTTYTAISEPFVFPVGTGDANLRGEVRPVSPYGYWYQTTAGELLCAETNAGVSVQIALIYDQY